MNKRPVLLTIAIWLICVTPICAVEIGYYPGLQGLIDRADAIVVLRVDQHLTDFGSPTLYSTHKCYIYQTLKGDIPKNTFIRLQLMDTEASLVSPYAYGSTHLMFLMKKKTEDEPTDYRTLTFKGAQTLLSPLGLEKEPEGKTIELQIKSLIRDSIAYQSKEYQEKQKFLKNTLGKQEIIQTQKQKEQITWVMQCTEDFKKIKLGMTREEVKKLLPMDGGFQFPVTVRFCHSECSYFKVDVEFSVERNPSDQNRVISSMNDKVVSVSKPYIEAPYYD